MTIDRGGLDYPIIVRDKFAKPLDRFIAKIDKARASYDRFKASTVDVASSAGVEKLNTAAEKTDKSMSKLSRSSTQLSQSTKQLTRQEENRRRGIERLNKEARTREVSEQRALVSARRQFQFQRQTASALRARVAAEEQVTRVIDRKAQREQVYRVLQERGLATDKKIRQELGLLTTAEKRLQAAQRQRRSVVDSLRKAQAEASNQRIRQIRAETQALNILNRAKITEARNDILRARGREDLIPGARRASAVETPQKTITLFDRLKARLSDTDNQANRVAFTFRRLFGILAAFTIARQAVAAFAGSVRSLVDASAQIETTALGIASVLVSVADIRDASGAAVDAVKGLAIAQGEARRQTQLLRKDALATTATFEELVEAFQVGLAPGLRSGLDVDQIRVFTRQISLAAAAIGLEQRQLAEEIRSILGGTISTRNTRIATALGITNDEIRQARQTGTLFEFLQERFKGFDAAGAQAADTFRGLVGRVRDGFRLLLAEGGVDFFEEIKNTLRDSLNAVQSLNASTGELQLNPVFVEAVRLVTNGLKNAVSEFREFTSSIGSSELVAFAKEVGGAFSLTASLISTIVQGVVQGLRVAGRLVSGIRRAVRIVSDLFQFDTGNFEFILKTLISIATVATAINAVFFIAALPLKAIVLAVSTIQGVLSAIIPLVSLLARGVALVGVAAAANPIILILTVVLGLVAFLAYQFGLLDGVLRTVGKTINNVFSSAEKKVTTLIGKVTKETEVGLEGIILNTSQALDKIGDKVAELFNDIRNLSEQTSIEFVFDAQFNFDSPFIRIANDLRKARKLESDLRREADQEAQSSFESFVDLQTRANRISRELATAGFGKPDLETAQALLELEKGRLKQFKDIETVIDSLRAKLTETSDLSVLGKFPTGQEILDLRKRDELQKDQTRSLIAQLEVKKDLLKADADRARINELLLSEFIRAEGGARAARDQDKKAVEARLSLEGALLANAIARSRVELQTANNTLREELARENAVNLRSRELTLARLSNDFASERLILAQQAVNAAQFETDIRLAGLQASLDQTEASLALTQSEIGRLKALEASGDLVDGQAQALQQAIFFEQQLLESRTLLNDQIELTKMKTAEQNLLLEEQLRFQQLAVANPIGAAFVDSLAQSFADASDLFTRFRDIFLSGVNGLAEEISSAIVDAFDPGADTSIRERLASFLRGIAQQIIATLLQIAITAAILNALSGGILGATIGSFAGQALGRGFNDGGPITSADRPKAQRRHLSHARARGYASGGMPGRPKNLHPSDKIPIWTAANEWVIRAKSAAKAGWDAMSVINNGNFEAPLLRAALGLSSSPVAGAAVAASRGPGFADGGRIAPAAADRGVGSGAPSVVGAVVAPTNENFSRMLEGGSAAMRQFVIEHAEEFRSWIGV
jgi:hypothetical protein